MDFIANLSFNLFLGIAKRRTDVILAQNGKEVRKNIEGYNLTFIDTILGILASIIIVCYIFYCISPKIKATIILTYCTSPYFLLLMVFSVI